MRDGGESVCASSLGPFCLLSPKTYANNEPVGRRWDNGEFYGAGEEMSNGGIGLAGRPTGFDLVETIEQLAKFPCAARIESGAARREVVAKRLGLLGDEW